MKRFWIVLFPLFLCSCNALPHKTVSLEQSRIITAIGIDKSESGYRLTCYEGTDLSEEDTPREDAVLVVDGETLSDALIHLKTVSNLSPLLDYAGYILLGEDLLKDGVLQPLSELYAHPEFPGAVPLLMATPSAQQVLSTLSKNSGDVSGILEATCRSSEQFSLVAPLSLPEFYNKVLSPNEDAYLPCFLKTEDTVIHSGTGVFCGEYLSAVLKEEEARGLGILLEQCQDSEWFFNADTTVYLRRAQTQLKKDQICIKLYADTASSQESHLLSQAVSQEVTDQVGAAITALSNAKSNVLGKPFGKSVFTLPVFVTTRIKELKP